MKYRARCSNRCYQHRKTIEGVYDPNDRLPCHVPGCTGKMRLDVTRERDPIGDRGGDPLCWCDGLPMSMRGAPHKKGSRGCNHREEYLLEKSLKPKSKHAAKPVDDEPPF